MSLLSKPIPAITVARRDRRLRKVCYWLEMARKESIDWTRDHTGTQPYVAHERGKD